MNLDFNRREFLGSAPALAALMRPERVLGANDRIGMAVIGCGGRGLLKEALQFAEESNLDIVAVCDTWRERREAAATAVKAKLGKEPEQLIHYHDVLAKKNVDAVIISTPDHTHCTILTAAVRVGKDAYCEKPLAMNMKELLSTVDTVKKSDRVVQIGTQIRSLPASFGARQFIMDGRLGKIFKVEQSRNAYKPYWQGYARPELKEEEVDWNQFLANKRYRPFDPDQYSAWMGYRDFSQGPHSQLMVHFIDLMHFVTGATVPKRVMAMGGTFRWKDSRNVPDSLEVVLEYPEGFLVRYNSTFGNGSNNFLKFFGTRGVLDASRWSWDEPFQVTGEGSSEADRIQPSDTVPLGQSVHHMKNYFDCIRSRKQPNAPIDAGYQHSVAAIMADISFSHGRQITYDPAMRRIHI